MNKLIIAALAISTLPLGQASAQRRQSSITPQSNKYEKVRQHFHNALPKNNLAAKITATDVRLIAQTSMQHDGSSYVLSDSTTFSYLGSRGGTYDDMWQSWNWDLASGYYYEHNGSTYDPASMMYTATYNTAGQLDYYIVQEWNSSTSAWENSYKSSYTYDASGNVLTNTDFDWNSTTSAWDNTYRTTNTYTATNRQASYLQEEWNTTSGTWENMTKNVYTWSTADKLTNILWQFWDGTAWQDAMKTSYSYDGSGNRVEGIGEQWNWSTSAWDTSGKDVYTGFVALHQPSQTTFMTWNSTTSSFENSYRTNYTYNSYAKPTYEFEEEWDQTSGTWGIDTYSYASRYHYETYTPTTKVEEIIPTTGNAVIYPVPASANISINISWTQPQRYTATIADVSGRPYKSWTAPGIAKNHQETIPVDNLPPGNYLLTVQGEKERIVKQFTVTH